MTTVLATRDAAGRPVLYHADLAQFAGRTVMDRIVKAKVAVSQSLGGRRPVLALVPKEST